MMDESQYITLDTLWKLETWACAWYDEALKAKFTSTSYSPDAATLDRLRGYFKAGLRSVSMSLRHLGVYVQ
jgi:hypothetical protein